MSVKWATRNVGATAPEDYGNYYAWGEVSTKNDYSWHSYKYHNHSPLRGKITKYGIVDNKTVFELTDDAAHVNWGGNWRMPTDAECTELRKQCTWELTTQNNINGYLVTSKSNGNSIFLPAAGYRGSTSLYGVGSNGYYWSSLLCKEGMCGAAYHLFFDPPGMNRVNGGRFCGLSIRPVCP